MNKLEEEASLEKKLLGHKILRKPNTYKDIRFGLIIIACFVFGFGGWAILSPLESAAIAPGKVVVSGNRRLVQHLEGGIVEALYVKNGSEVKKGQTLLALEDIRSKVSLDVLQNELFELALIAARLKAEINGSLNFTIPPLLQAYANHRVKIAVVYEKQKRIFSANKKAYHSQLEILKKKINQLQEQLKGEKTQLTSLKQQQEISQIELKEVRILYEKRLVERSRLLNLQREKSRLFGEYGARIASIATIEQRMGETEQQIITFKNQTRKELLAELREVETNFADILEKEKAANDIHERTKIRAPQTGTVVGMNVHTIGQVIKPGETLLEVVPKHELLVIDAEVKPHDIDVVKKGLKAKIQLTAFQTRTTPSLLGTVRHVSADAITDEKTGRNYYNATINIDKNELKKLGDLKLYPGMPAEVMIITDRMTPWGYFISPIKRSFNKAFREQ